MTISATINGKPRKQLAEQLDRLDAILDVLAEGLPAAVADACREGAREAVRIAITEVLGNPELRALLAPRPTDPAPSPVPVPVARPNPWARLREVLARARTAVTRRVHGAWDAVTSPVRAATGLVAAVGKLLRRHESSAGRNR